MDKFSIRINIVSLPLMTFRGASLTHPNWMTIPFGNKQSTRTDDGITGCPHNSPEDGGILNVTNSLYLVTWRKRKVNKHQCITNTVGTPPSQRNTTYPVYKFNRLIWQLVQSISLLDLDLSNTYVQKTVTAGSLAAVCDFEIQQRIAYLYESKGMCK